MQRQAAANTGAADSDDTVRLAADDFSNLPVVSDVISVTLTPTSDTGWMVRVENVSDETTLTTSDAATQAVPMSPGVWAIHTAAGPIFTAGEANRGEGLAAIAEDGDVSGLSAELGTRTGLTVPQSPGTWALHTGSDPTSQKGKRIASRASRLSPKTAVPTVLQTKLPENRASSQRVASTPPSVLMVPARLARAASTNSASPPHPVTAFPSSTRLSHRMAFSSGRMARALLSGRPPESRLAGMSPTWSRSGMQERKSIKNPVWVSISFSVSPRPIRERQTQTTRFGWPLTRSEICRTLPTSFGSPLPLNSPGPHLPARMRTFWYAKRAIGFGQSPSLYICPERPKPCSQPPGWERKIPRAPALGENRIPTPKSQRWAVGRLPLRIHGHISDITLFNRSG